MGASKKISSFLRFEIFQYVSFVSSSDICRNNYSKNFETLKKGEHFLLAANAEVIQDLLGDTTVSRLSDEFFPSPSHFSCV